MKINGHEVCLIDDGTLDTVVTVNGKDYRWSSEAIEREGDGSLSEAEFMRLAKESIEAYEEDIEYENSLNK